MTDGARAILLELTENAGSLDALFVWVRRQGWTADVQMHWPEDEDGTYQASIQRPVGKRRYNIGNGFGRSGYDALGMAIVYAAARDRICGQCYGQGRFRTGMCRDCHGSGLAPTDVA